MPIFNVRGKSLENVKLINFKLEKELQLLIESNLTSVFNCRLVATEFSTGAEHAGRIDTLALSEDNNPGIIEYKKEESSDLINQSLFYLSWIQDHRGDFQIAAERSQGKSVEIDWSDIRVICIAPGYKKYDLHAVKAMGANIELWQYKLFDNQTLYIEEVFRKSGFAGGKNAEGKNLEYVEAGKKAAISRATGVYTVEEHLDVLDKSLLVLANDLRDYSMSLDDSVEENPKKFYIAYKVAQNFLCLQTGKNKITLFLKLNPKSFKGLPRNARDVSDIGHYGTGNFELIVDSVEQMEQAKALIKQAFDEVGG
jgi:predicted transport protein